MPNFDDTDLGILGICFIALLMAIVGAITKPGAAVLFTGLGGCVTGVSALVRGRGRSNGVGKPAEPADEPGLNI